LFQNLNSNLKVSNKIITTITTKSRISTITIITTKKAILTTTTITTKMSLIFN
jgi:hypothetical protein